MLRRNPACALLQISQSSKSWLLRVFLILHLTMYREKVISQTLNSIGFDPSQKLLELEFTSGSIYQYFNVPNRVYLELISAESKGRYFDSWIRDKYAFKRIDK